MRWIALLTLLLTLAFVAACSGGTEPVDGRSEDGAADAEAEAGTTSPACDYPKVVNPTDCPAQYNHSYSGESCPSEGIRCSYPGRGDGNASGCLSTAILECEQPDGGPGIWLASQ